VDQGDQRTCRGEEGEQGEHAAPHVSLRRGGRYRSDEVAEFLDVRLDIVEAVGGLSRDPGGPCFEAVDGRRADPRFVSARPRNEAICPLAVVPFIEELLT
jgi:hypothetical protein